MIRQQIALAAATAMSAGLVMVGAPTVQARPLPATPVTIKDLPKASDFRFDDDVFATKFRAKGEGQAAVSLCQTRTWSEFAPNATFVGEYAVKGNSEAHGSASIASFKTHAAAVKAAKAMAADFRTCGSRLEKDTNGEANVHRQYNRTVTLPGGQVATLVAVNWEAAGWSSPMVTETAVVATGTHAQIISIDHGTQSIYGTGEILSTVKRSVRTLA